MKPDQHKKKRSAQYKRKRAAGQKKEGTDGNAKPQNAPNKKTSDKSSDINFSSQPQPQAQQQYHGKQLHMHVSDDSEEIQRFSRRKLQSNWDRYEPINADDQEENSEDMRGADFKTLVTQTGDAWSQFRFKEEQLWEEEESEKEESSFEDLLALDCQALSGRLMQIPIPARLNIEPIFFEPSMLLHLDEVALQHKEKLCCVSAKRMSSTSKSSLSCQVTSKPQLLVNKTVEAETSEVDHHLMLESSPMAVAHDQVSQNMKSELQSVSISTENDQLITSPKTESTTAFDDERAFLNTISGQKTTESQLKADEAQNSLSSSNHPVKSSKHGTRYKDNYQGSENVLEHDKRPVTEEKQDFVESRCLAENIDQNIDTGDAEDTEDLKLPYGSQIYAPRAQLAESKSTADVSVVEKLAHSSVPLGTDINSDNDDELDFLLSLENPVQSVGKLVMNPSLSNDASISPTSTPTPATSSSTSLTCAPSGSKEDSLEEWLDSVLED